MFQPYIILDGYRYKTLAKQWRPVTIRPATPRLTLNGVLEATFGVRSLRRWEGMVSVRHGTAAPGAANGTLEGNIFTLRQTIEKRSFVAFTDHNGTAYPSAVLVGPFDERSLVNVWDSAANKYFVNCIITA